MPAFDITEPGVIAHGLGSEDLIVQVWQNGYQVQPDVQIVDKDHILVRTVVPNLANPLHVVVLAIGPTKNTVTASALLEGEPDKNPPETTKSTKKAKSSGTKKSTGRSTARKSSAKDS